MVKQLSLFEQATQHNDRVHWKLYIDGASRGNPGPAGAGIYLVKGNDALIERGFFLGYKTNNQAEYSALIIGLFYSHKLMDRNEHITIYSDSQLLVRQIQGHYRIKNEKLHTLHARAMEWLQKFNHRLDHIFREHNQVADRCANRGIDEQLPVPEELQHYLD